MTKNEQWILEYLRENQGFNTPTAIGWAHAAAHPAVSSCCHHSSWASPILKRLVAKGLVERNSKGHYRINDKCL